MISLNIGLYYFLNLLVRRESLSAGIKRSHTWLTLAPSLNVPTQNVRKRLNWRMMVPILDTAAGVLWSCPVPVVNRPNSERKAGEDWHLSVANANMYLTIVSIMAYRY